ERQLGDWNRSGRDLQQLRSIAKLPAIWLNGAKSVPEAAVQSCSLLPFVRGQARPGEEVPSGQRAQECWKSRCIVQIAPPVENFQKLRAPAESWSSKPFGALPGCGNDRLFGSGN